MPKRKTPIEKLAAAVAEVGIDKAAEHFEFLRAMKPAAPKPKVVPRKEKKAEETRDGLLMRDAL